jgi:GTP cyclohydrolase II
MPACEFNDKIIWCGPMKALSSSLVASVERAIVEIRQGKAVLLKHACEPTLAVRSAELLSANAFDALSSQNLSLALTAKRAEILGFNLPSDSTQTIVLSIPAQSNLEIVTWIIDPLAPKPASANLNNISLQSAKPGSVYDAAITLLKLSRLLPAAIMVDPPAHPDLLKVTALSVMQFQRQQALSLIKIAEARVPLKDAENARIIAFRPGDGGTEHLAIVIGEPDISQPVLIRLHSECFTGDLLGSLRCDCGDQLRGAIAEIAQAGSGIVLYLAQEGRGIGLVNKLRAYQLQDRGFDTIDANLQLGFDDDERIYLPAIQILKLLDIQQVRLMTNNPLKVEALQGNGITVVERVSHVFPSNDHNLFYLNTKAIKGGHLF